MGKVERVSKQILSYLLNDFQARELAAKSLEDGYIGVPLGDLRQKCFNIDQTTTTVDFDLALKALEGKKQVATGPMAAPENTFGLSRQSFESTRSYGSNAKSFSL